MTIKGLAHDAAQRILDKIKGPIEVGMVLGSGLGTLADEVENAVRFPYHELPGFPVSSVSSHASELVVGTLMGVKVAILAGRAHFYERGDATIMKQPLATLKALGCDHILLTNAAGSLREEIAPGELMLIDDHINWSGRSPLIGVETDDRFVGLTEAYDAQLRSNLTVAAASASVDLKSGVYAWFSGPNFETPAEIRAVRMLGADAVGMSTVPEVILARWMGMRVAAISTITNYGAGMTGTELSHEETKEVGPIGAQKLIKVIRAYLQALAA
ncbi:purine-nucleoside phosphorylase [Cohaesibacter sp. CAU 1516]|uniref:purine-nucleoside phosphorylase n=1 Tax=Cohaesibacter sp. CAU 1516 TaxID=2576038 RepID=UPI0010FEDF0F|nr:purine-nucleoside phosphorylase [Cohaesibacter sp. CAU 1516]TLP46014.1 purine-nucleoside phosphorylase [Cohaesibacter sp. CAU 1516]